MILGGGPAGLGLALQLLRRKELHISVTIIERENYVGGLTAGCEYDGIHFDFGSHRLHPNTNQRIMHDIAELLGENLLARQRNGRIKLLGRFVRFPLNPFDLFLHLPFTFPMKFAWDMFKGFIETKKTHLDTFESVLLEGLGETLCKTFYFPYAQKIWGLPANQIDAEQAYKRVRAKNFRKIISKIFLTSGKSKKSSGNIFYYPAKGYHQIANALAEEVRKIGGKIFLSSEVRQLRFDSDGTASIMFDRYHRNTQNASDKKESMEMHADLVFSTIPVTELCVLMHPVIPDHIQKNCNTIAYRNMVLCFFVLDIDQFTPYDAHYFPEKEYIFSRVSEPKNYSGAPEPHDLTGLCVEIPCSDSDSIWNASDDELCRSVLRDLEKARLPVRMPIKRFFTKRLRNAYPVYTVGFQIALQEVLHFLDTYPRLVTLGRQGLFAHDNTHHTMDVAYCASECVLPEGVFDWLKWKEFRKQFQTHIVED